MTPTANENSRLDQIFFQVGDPIEFGGIYRVHHLDHRPTHEVTLLRNEVFPPCARCADSVRFELVRSIRGLEDLDFHIRLFNIPNDEVEPLP